ncbi:MAG: AbrB family transcriptional regulator [Paracoccaceae bacterium]
MSKLPSPPKSLLARRALTGTVAAAGTAAFHVLGGPLPLLVGPMAACLVAALGHAPLAGMGILAVAMRTVLGVAVGASVTPELVGDMPKMAASLAFIPLFILVIGAIGYPIFRFGFGFNHPTAYYSAMPGGLQDMLIFGEEAGGNVRVMSLIHATRVLVLVAIAPVIMSGVWGVDLTQPPGQMASEISRGEIFLMVASGLVGWKLAERAGMFGATILGPLILTAALSLSGFIDHRPPAEFIWAAQFFIGISVGAKYAGVTMRELRIDVAAGLIYSIARAVVSLAFFLFISQAGIAPRLEAFLAFLPGGQGEMVIIAIIAGADLAYVVSHHLLRLVLVILFAPVVELLLKKRFR